MADVIMYTLRNCPTCEQARRDLTDEGVEFEERVVDDNSEWFEEASGLGTNVPIVVRGDKVETGWRGDPG
jgi:glutaredoxin